MSRLFIVYSPGKMFCSCTPFPLQGFCLKLGLPDVGDEVQNRWKSFLKHPETTENPTICFPECTMSQDCVEDDVDHLFNEDVRSRPSFASGDCKPIVRCKKVPVKETSSVHYTKHANGKKMINEYVKERKISSRRYGKVVLYRNSNNGMLFAIKMFYRPSLRKMHIIPSETAISNVLREVSIMKMLEHPNIVNLVEVIDDPSSDYLYMVLEYVGTSGTCNISETQGVINERTARRYFKDTLAGIMYLHNHNVVHGDIKPENLLLTESGRIKIGDFGVSYVYKDDNDEFRRCLGTPAFTAPECCSDKAYSGKAADTWAVGITLFYMVVGCYPFIGDGILDTYDKIVNNPISFPEELDPELKDLLRGLLCKDPKQRTSLAAAAKNPWVEREGGAVLQWRCGCKLTNIPP